MWEHEEKFSKAHPLNSKIRDNDIFLHATSMKKYLAIQSTRCLLKNAPQRNFSISQAGVCFEKYEDGKHGGACAKRVIDLTMNGYCYDNCRSDQSTEAVVLQIIGKDLKKLGCPVYVDWNKHFPYLFDDEHRPVDVDYDSLLLSIVVDCDVPLEYLSVAKKITLKELQEMNRLL